MFEKIKSLAVNNRKGQGTLTIAIIASTLFATIVASATSWYLSMNNKVDGFDDKLESMSIAMSEWQRLEHMSLEELEAHRDEYKEPWDVGSKYKVSVTLGEQGTFEDGQCKTTTSSGSSDEKNCFKDTIMTVYDSNDIPLYTTRTLPLSSQSSGGDSFPVGTILPYVGDISAIPKKWHLCDGTDGTPNLLDGRFLEGATNIKIYKEPGLPNLKGSLGHPFANVFQVFEASGSFYSGISQTYGALMNGSDIVNYWIEFDASRYSGIYKDNCTTVQPLAYTVYYIMKIRH